MNAMTKIASLFGVSLDYIAGITDDRGGLHMNNSDQKTVMQYMKLSERSKGRVEQLITELIEEQE